MSARNSLALSKLQAAREVQSAPNSLNNDSEMVSSAEFCGNFLLCQELKIETKVGELFEGKNWGGSLANQKSRMHVDVTKSRLSELYNNIILHLNGF